ncbi:MAG: PilZ domain-containing protein [Gammaproteobacteria bacterium]
MEHRMSVRIPFHYPVTIKRPGSHQQFAGEIQDMSFNGARVRPQAGAPVIEPARPMHLSIEAKTEAGPLHLEIPAFVVRADHHEVALSFGEYDETTEGFLQRQFIEQLTNQRTATAIKTDPPTPSRE